MSVSQPSSAVEIDWAGRSVSVEYQWVKAKSDNAPLLIFLHEGLGSCAMWRGFPQQLCEALQCQGLIYSRPGYGKSTPRDTDEHWGVDFMHRQAYEVLPALIAALEIDPLKQPLWLFGHSDGGSIALLFAAKFPEQLAGAIILAPHIMVEDFTISSIEQARVAYTTTNLPEKLGKYHNDPDSPFWGWNDIWLHPPFRDWSIEEEIKSIRCPLLAIQGRQDEYGTLEQIHGIKRRVPHTQLAELENCGHSPHRDQPKELTLLTTQFLNNSTGGITE